MTHLEVRFHGQAVSKEPQFYQLSSPKFRPMDGRANHFCSAWFLMACLCRTRHRSDLVVFTCRADCRFDLKNSVPQAATTY